MRLHTQTLLRVARTQDGPAWRRVITGLAAIDDDISTLFRQVEQPDGD